MRILVLCGNHRSAREEMMRNHGPNVTIFHPDMIIKKDDTEVHYRVVRNQNDSEMLRGQKFDLVIEDGSYNYERSHERGHVLNYLRAMVLR